MTRWILLQVSETSVRLGLVQSKTQDVQWVGERDYGVARTMEESVEVLLAPAELRRVRPVRAELLPPLIQLRRLDRLPPIGAAELNELVHQAVRRFFRTDGGPMVTSARWMGVEEAEAGVARAAAASLALVNALEATVEATGHELEWVGPAGEAHISSSPSLMTPQHQIRRRRRQALALAPFILLAGVSWLGAAGCYLWDLRRDRRELLAESQVVAVQVRQLEEIRGRVNDFRPFLEAVKANGPENAWVQALLARLTMALPEGCHLRSASLAGSMAPVRIEGLCPEPLELVRSLEEAGIFGARLERAPEPLSAEDGQGVPFALTMRIPT